MCVQEPCVYLLSAASVVIRNSNFLGYFVWGVSELHVNKIPHNTSDSLVQKNKEVMGSLDRDTMARACRWLQPWIEALVEIEGDFIT